MNRVSILALALALLLSTPACTREVEKVVVVTPTELPATPTAQALATPTPAPTRETAAYSLKCQVVSVKLEDALPANVYALRFAPSAGATEVGGVRVDIAGETGDAVQTGQPSNDFDYYGNLYSVIDEERTYTASQHTYRIAGKISYRVSDFPNPPVAGYHITVTGGPFGTTPKTCSG